MFFKLIWDFLLMLKNSNGLQIVRTQVGFFHLVPCSEEIHDLGVVKQWIRRTSCNKKEGIARYDYF